MGFRVTGGRYWPILPLTPMVPACYPSNNFIRFDYSSKFRESVFSAGTSVTLTHEHTTKHALHANNSSYFAQLVARGDKTVQKKRVYVKKIIAHDNNGHLPRVNKSTALNTATWAEQWQPFHLSYFLGTESRQHKHKTKIKERGLQIKKNHRDKWEVNREVRTR